MCAEASCGELVLELAGGDEHLAAHVTALLLGSQLVLEVDACRTGPQHPLHQLVDVQGAAEAGLGVGHDRNHPIPEHHAVVLGPLDLVGTTKGVVEALHDGRHRVDRVEALVRVHLTSQVGVAGHLPTGEVQRREATLDVLDGLATGHRSEGVHVVRLVHLAPEHLGAMAGDRALREERASQPDDV